MSDPLNVAVLLGGSSAEREISLDSGAAVAEALRKGGHLVHEVDVTDPAQVVSDRAVVDADVVFPALHGGWGEDGRIQALLELTRKAYVGSGPAASAAAMDKVWTKQICGAMGIPTPSWAEVPPDASLEDILPGADQLGYPVVFKPVLEGSAIGVYVVGNAEELTNALMEVGPRTSPWMLEQFIEGRELTVPWLWDQPTPLVEIRPKEGFYDYTNKYTKGKSEYDCPADLDAPLALLVVKISVLLARALRLRDMARIDVRLSADGSPYILEANTIPGMTELSLLPMGAAAKGIDFVSLCDRLVRTAAERGPDLEK